SEGCRIPNHQDRIVLRHKSGEAYRNISAALKFPMSTVASIICKWKNFKTTRTLPSAGPPMKTGHEAAKRPTETLKELQGFLESTDCLLHVTTRSHILHISGQWDMWDETKVELFGYSSEKYVWLKSMQRNIWHQKTTVHIIKHGGGSVMLWDFCFGPKKVVLPNTIKRLREIVDVSKEQG
uniref:Sleeping Beauty transposase HTH domain-containing protein n=1 Tax=Denticeps clupeoides TaxID=299321 RepID=A0AAY4CRJ8_9TELE